VFRLVFLNGLIKLFAQLENHFKGINIMENKIEIYASREGQTHIEVQFEGDTVWLNQSQLIELFQSSKANISEHIKRIFISEELSADSTVRKFRTVQQEGKRQVSREIDYFNLDLIISVGYRVNRKRGIEFRQWATKRLKDYLIEGVAINEKRLAAKVLSPITV
jgi:hypothetical protein